MSLAANAIPVVLPLAFMSRYFVIASWKGVTYSIRAYWFEIWALPKASIASANSRAARMLSLKLLRMVPVPLATAVSKTWNEVLAATMVLFHASPIVCVDPINDLKNCAPPTAIPKAPKAFVIPPMTFLNEAPIPLASALNLFIEDLAFFSPLSKSLLLMVIFTTKSLFAISLCFFEVFEHFIEHFLCGHFAGFAVAWLLPRELHHIGRGNLAL